VSDVSFPRQRARTRGFACGAPRLFTLSPDGERVVFVRSRGGTDPVGLLWELDAATGTETLLADPHVLHDGDEELTWEEKARRERMRESGAGIVGYSTDDAVTRAVFMLSGGLYGADLVDVGPVRALDVPGPVLDPRLSPDGRHVAYVAQHALRVCAWDGSDDRALAEPRHALESCGTADFAAAEELDRQRGYWWSPASDAVLVERVDETPVQEWWIADPVHPERAPHAHRYPAAGTATAVLSLQVVRLDGTAVDVEWDSTAYEYLVDVSWTSYGDPLVVVSTRDQRTQLVLAVDPATGATRTVAELTDPCWVDAVPGATRWAPDGRLLTHRVDADADAYRLHLGDGWLTPADVQVRGVLDAGEDGVLVAVAADPLTTSVALAGWDGSWTVVADGAADPSVWSARRSGGTTLLVRRGLDDLRARYEVRGPGGAVHEVASYAETPVVDPVVHLLEAGPDRLRTAALFPTGHEPGSRRLPVVLSPYGGPHHAEVVASRAAYCEDQWLADQGFVVVVADGRGTPGRGPAWDRAILHDYANPVLDDQVTALHAVAEAFPGDLDLERVGMRGWSFGGYLSALAVLKRPDVFAAAVAGAPPSDFRLYDTAYSERYLGNPAEDPGPYDVTSLLPLAPQLSRPLLIIHGMTDDNVVVAHTLALSAALTVAGRPHQVLPLSGVTHMTPQEEVAENKLLLELDFLRTHLGV
jgi:dipeptidyl-peptidase-4